MDEFDDIEDTKNQITTASYVGISIAAAIYIAAVVITWVYFAKLKQVDSSNNKWKTKFGIATSVFTIFIAPLWGIATPIMWATEK